ncbi:hypothetical protein E2C01_055681 [Portunus trituberculatus]|uniref:Uncharacterized protein n=1 Tax=Portunus trituberculatus TaxID=210409 RepID=A0A5B7GWL5_PORTR|nr:hypothetical protein [Portunus trituberculatus]
MVLVMDGGVTCGGGGGGGSADQDNTGGIPKCWLFSHFEYEFFSVDFLYKLHLARPSRSVSFPVHCWLAGQH